MGLDAIIQVRNFHNAQILEEMNKRIRYSVEDYLRWEFTLDDVIELNTLWRYWGPGYERGPWISIAGVIKTTKMMTGLPVHYGSDIESDIKLMTKERMREYWKHFTGPNGNDYREKMR